MSTRASIKITDDYGVSYYLYRGHDGFPDVVEPDINKAINICNSRFGQSEIGQLISIILGEAYHKAKRIQYYELTPGEHGDECYIYLVHYKDNKWMLSNPANE